MTLWLINLTGLLLMVLIVWWFWISKPAATRATQGAIEVLVADGVYTPARIEVPAGQPLVLRFLRKDPSPCAEQVLFPDFELSAELPLNTTREVRLTPATPGEYEFTCQMQMYRGKLVVTAAGDQ